ncbi:hypothetical protein AGMMS49975_03900 [Clostridia bacterium]|nr:hypothetical protein AGMMS49975_03900 [Clostridia bacterium]
MKKLNKKGFTLIELVVVIVILGILALLVIPKISAYTDSAKLSTCVANMRPLKSAITIWQVDHINGDPTDAAQLTIGGLGQFIEGGAQQCPLKGTYSIIANTSSDPLLAGEPDIQCDTSSLSKHHKINGSNVNTISLYERVHTSD